MNKEYLKWKVGYADEFEMVCGGDIIRFRYQGEQNYDNVLSPNITNWCFYPQLNQAAIEGIIKKHGIQFDLYYNKKTGLWDMIFYNKKNKQYRDSWELLPHTDNISSDNKTPDQAKEQALEYIWKQEKNK